jgi:hypothetical protein
MMKSPKKFTAQYNIFCRFHPSRPQKPLKSFMGFAIGFIIQWCRHLINALKSTKRTEDNSNRRVDRIIWVAGLMVFAIALIEAASLDGQKNGTTALALNKPAPITQAQNVQTVAHQRHVSHASNHR